MFFNIFHCITYCCNISSLIVRNRYIEFLFKFHKQFDCVK